VATIIRLNAWLAPILEVQQRRVFNKHTGSEVRVITSDAGTSYGLLADFIVCDELTGWAKRDLWDSLLSASAKRAHCALVCIGNAGFKDSWQWSTRESVRLDPGWYFSRLDGPKASWISADRLAEQERLLPRVAFERLWLNRWSEGAGDALESGLVDGAVTLDRAPEPDPGCVNVAGVDLSLSRDATAVVVLAKSVGFSRRLELPERRRSSHVLEAMRDLAMIDEPADEPRWERVPGDGRLRLCGCRVWRPTPGRKVELEQVESHILAVHRVRPLSIVALDVWQAAYLAERLAKMGIQSWPMAQTGNVLQSMASEVMSLFREKLVDLYPDQALLSDLRSLRVEERQYGFRLTSPRGTNEAGGTRHGDCASAFSLAAIAAKQVRAPAIGRRGSLVLSAPSMAMA